MTSFANTHEQALADAIAAVVTTGPYRNTGVLHLRWLEGVRATHCQVLLFTDSGEIDLLLSRLSYPTHVEMCGWPARPLDERYAFRDGLFPQSRQEQPDRFSDEPNQRASWQALSAAVEDVRALGNLRHVTVADLRVDMEGEMVDVRAIIFTETEGYGDYIAMRLLQPSREEMAVSSRPAPSPLLSHHTGYALPAGCPQF
ncbi:hypothetical protein [Burkholderia sp. Ac-20365]|uniref:hypothetical protein n=1 Tax=Burkholderia sp. Ac-20365 TaxID=2703897 RepID=UPI00197B3435|nr:hypothetical protein [Burkholderia sp. Ac-20365]MBN3761360.1 hypothetical protein [Burkholderia sp. Ac-20365]